MGICGLGRIGSIHAKYFSVEKKMYEIVAVCDNDQQRASEFAAEYQCASYNNFDEFLKKADMELVIIATRSLDHAVNAVQALAAEKIVLLEKPIAVTSDDFRKLQQADKKYPGKLFFLHNHRFEPAFQNIRKIINSGVLGKLQVVKLCRHHPFRRRADWQTILSCGGGQLSCWGPHLIDQALQYINAPVKDVCSYLKRINTPGDADDHMKIIITGENDVVVEIEASDAAILPDPYCKVCGNRGSLICADEKNIQLKYIDPEYKFPEISASANQPPLEGGYGHEEKFPWIEKMVKVKPDTNMWEQVEKDLALHLYRAIREDIPFPIKNSEGLEVVRITEIVKEQNKQFSWKQ